MTDFLTKPKINIGVLGHVDSGKTSLCASLSTILSTAALDKNPQSQERGITLDLQFSAVETEDFLFTLTDCPGHASLIRTIMGGAQIIDMALMVIDIQKGIQTQTAEGLVIAQITVDEMVVVINKIDSIPPEAREQKIARCQTGLKKAFSTTKFANAPMVVYSAKEQTGKDTLLSAMGECAKRIVAKKLAHPPSIENLLFLVDHCFPIKGKGTVATGTVIRGNIKVNQDVYIPHLATSKKVKSIQMFKQPVQEAKGGDRVGVLLTQFDAKTMERGIICGKAGEVQLVTQAIVKVSKVTYYKQPIKSKAKFHVTIGHTTAMASFQFFGTSADAGEDYQLDKEYKYAETFDGENTYAVMTLETPTFCPLDWIFIASKLDTDINANQCRLAFHGHIVQQIDAQQLETLKVFTYKEKEGKIERATSPTSAIGVSLFKKETDMNLFVNMKVFLPNGAEGKISGTFGKSGKFKVDFKEPQEDLAGKTITFPVKRYVFDKNKQLRQ